MLLNGLVLTRAKLSWAVGSSAKTSHCHLSFLSYGALCEKSPVR